MIKPFKIIGILLFNILVSEKLQTRSTTMNSVHSLSTYSWHVFPFLHLQYLTDAFFLFIEYDKFFPRSKFDVINKYLIILLFTGESK